jgi:hypothetical protein
MKTALAGGQIVHRDFESMRSVLHLHDQFISRVHEQGLRIGRDEWTERAGGTRREGYAVFLDVRKIDVLDGASAGIVDQAVIHVLRQAVDVEAPHHRVASQLSNHPGG